MREKKVCIKILLENVYRHHIVSYKCLCPHRLHLLLAALAFIVLVPVFCLLQTYDLRHLSIEMWQTISRNGYATALRLHGELKFE